MKLLARRSVPCGLTYARFLYVSQEAYGWHVPILTSHNTTLQFANRVDFQSMRLRYSQPYYVQV